MIDPYGKENMLLDDYIPPTYEKPVYNRPRFNIKHIVKMVYIPNVRLMFKLMRACISVEEKEELWYFDYKKKEHEHEHVHEHDQNE